jgi:hypothetical protein
VALNVVIITVNPNYSSSERGGSVPSASNKNGKMALIKECWKICSHLCDHKQELEQMGKERDRLNKIIAERHATAKTPQQEQARHKEKGDKFLKLEALLIVPSCSRRIGLSSNLSKYRYPANRHCVQ